VAVGQHAVRGHVGVQHPPVETGADPNRPRPVLGDDGRLKGRCLDELKPSAVPERACLRAEGLGDGGAVLRGSLYPRGERLGVGEPNLRGEPGDRRRSGCASNATLAKQPS
jgi:hypothetical protein